MIDESTELELAKLRSLVSDLRDVMSAEHPEAWENMPMWGGGTDYSDFAFGFSISGAVVTVNSGKVRHGTRTPITVTGDSFEIASDQTYIYVTYTYGSGVATFGTPTTVEPVDAEGVHNHILYLVTLTDGVASVESGDIKHIGDIWLPGNAG